jgi:hypothetical protein
MRPIEVGGTEAIAGRRVVGLYSKRRERKGRQQEESES